MLPMKRRSFRLGIGFCIFCALGGPARGDDWRRHLQTQPELGWDVQQRFDAFEEGGSADGFPSEILKEFAADSFSRGRLSLRGQTGDLTVFDLAHPQGAFGLFSFFRASLEAPAAGHLALPADNFLTSNGQLAFWKSHFMFRLRADDAEALRRLAFAAIGAVRDPDLYPFSVVQLPERDLIPDSVQLFLGEKALRAHGKFPSPLFPAIGFDRDAELAVARYAPSGMTLFLLGYPTAAVAEQQAARLNGAAQSHFFDYGVFLKRSGLLVAMVFGAEEEARPLLERVHYDAQVKWIYERGLTDEERRRRRGEVVTFFGIVTSSILFTAVFAVVVLVAGLCTGVARYLILKRFPILTARSEMIRLDIEERGLRG